MDNQEGLLRGLLRGLTSDVVGGPADIAEQIVNLGLAGVGFAGNKLGLLKPEQMPKLLEGSPGTSEWFAKLAGNQGQGGAYDAGRVIPAVAGLAKAAAPSVANAVGKGLTLSRGKQAQRGAIRAGGDPELFMQHSLDATAMEKLLTPNGSLELYSPSIAITRGNKLFQDFGGVTLIPKVGAFDPATSPSTLFNRDAYTPRYGDYRGVAAGPSLKPNSESVYRLMEGSDFINSLRAPGVYQAPFAMDELRYLGNRLDGNDPFNGGIIKTLAKRVDRAYEQGHDLQDMFGRWYPKEEKDTWSDDLRLGYEAYASLQNEFARGHFTVEKGVSREDRLNNAKNRMLDRLGNDRAPLKLKESTAGTTGSFYHDVSIEGSPAFRSFSEFERSPLGSKLLTTGSANQPEFQTKVLDKTFGRAVDFPLSPTTKESLVRNVSRGRDYFHQEMDTAGVLSDMHYAGFPLNFVTKEMEDKLWNAATLARRAMAYTPSNYAELKVSGPVPVNAENWAGAITTDEHTLAESVQKALAKSGVPLVHYKSSWLRSETDPQTTQEIMQALQANAGLARRRPIP